jgi:bifunctional DNA-binding transcriptional regulator/antitoxin component of YhaV-PrlF toxin-antitoxin module
MENPMEGLLYGSGKVGSRGQVVIPVDFRNQYKVNPGDTVIFMGNPQQNAFAIMKAEYLSEMQAQLDSARQQLARMKPEAK